MWSLFAHLSDISQVLVIRALRYRRGLFLRPAFVNLYLFHISMLVKRGQGIPGVSTRQYLELVVVKKSDAITINDAFERTAHRTKTQSVFMTFWLGHLFKKIFFFLIFLAV